MIRVARHAYGPRVYVLRVRVHHGPVAGAIAAVLLIAGKRRAGAIAAVFAATDLPDFPFRDRDNHRPLWARKES